MKVCVIVLAGLLATLILRKRSAAIRHWVLATTMVCAMACAGACDFPQGGALTLALVAIVVLATITTIQRIVHVVRQPTTEEHE